LEIVIEGVLEAFFETGTEGVIWSIYKDDCQGYEGLIPILEGDYLTVWDSINNLLFEGKVVYDHETGWTAYPFNPTQGQQSVLGMWVHWIQKGMKPEDWAKLFISIEGTHPNRAKVIRTV
jgi:hypothetical protein